LHNRAYGNSYCRSVRRALGDGYQMLGLIAHPSIPRLTFTTPLQSVPAATVHATPSGVKTIIDHVSPFALVKIWTAVPLFTTPI
tara:strand:- start:307 stop:558 length:252 start_codon:yes stop_codon:yes gene_type:complete